MALAAKSGGTFNKNGNSLFPIYICIEENGTSRRTNHEILGDPIDTVKGTRELYFLIGTDEMRIDVDTSQDIVLEDDSVILITVEKVSKTRMWCGQDRDEDEIVNEQYNHGSGELVKIKGEEFAFIDFRSRERTVLFKQDFSQELSETEKAQVISIIILLCELRNRYEDTHATTRTIDYITNVTKK